jgi:voltage-gated potassium channel Kch
MQRPKFSDRLRYAFDNSMSRGPIALVGWLGLASVLLVLVTSLIVRLATGGQMSLRDILWDIMFQALTPNPVAPDAGPWIFLLAMLFITLGSLFMVSILIGVLTTGIEGRLQALRKGRTLVLEQNHTLILGWSPKVFTIISELSIANENQTKPRIVILAEKDKVEMEDEIRSHVGSTGKTKVICRTGSPLDLNDLEIVNPHGARSIIILAPESEDPDSEVIKTILALTNNANRKAEAYHIVAELSNSKNLAVAQMVSNGEAQLILTGDLISRIIVQTARQSGLSVVYTELLDFEGDELYFQEEPQLIGKTFGEALLAYEDSAVVGLRFADGRVKLNPPMDLMIAGGDKVIAVSEDDDTVRLAPYVGSGSSWIDQIQIDPAAIHNAAPAPRQPERTLLLGWNQRAPTIINELDRYVEAGSQLMVVADAPDAQADIERECADLKNQSVTCQQADTTDRRELDQLEIPTYQQVIILCYSDTLDQQEADARTLITLLHLRDIAEKNSTHFRIVSEMLDVRNRELAEVTKADDFIVSNKLTSLMLAQVSENRELNAVFTDIFDPAGSEVYLKPATDYIEPDRSINFYTIVEAARRRGEVAIGYRQIAQAENAQQAYGLTINPDKSKRITLTAEDRIIVIAEQ